MVDPPGKITSYHGRFPQQLWYRTAGHPTDSNPETANPVTQTSNKRCTFDLSESGVHVESLGVCKSGLAFGQCQKRPAPGLQTVKQLLPTAATSSNKHTKQQSHKAEATKHSEKLFKALLMPVTLAVTLAMPKAAFKACRRTKSTNLIRA